MIKRLSELDFDQVYTLMKKSFPEDEYRPYTEQRALLYENGYCLYGIKDGKGEACAFIALWDLGDLAFIEHFAVDPVCRNNGMGTSLLRELISLLGKPLCLEVEPPENELTARRVSFYRRNGFHLNEYPYMQPSLSIGKNAVPLLIMTYGKTMDEQEFEDIKKALYTEVYKCL